MRVLVTGGLGFIGRYVQDELERAGHEPVSLDLPFNVLDLGKTSNPNCDAVIHLAGMLGTAELFDDFDTAVDVNIKGTQRVLEHCRRWDARFVGITMPQVWANVYQATKLCSRTLATAWHESFGVPVSHVCAFNAFGIGQKYGPGHPQKIIPTFSSLAWRNEPIPIWGDGEQTVDLVSASDVASVLVQALEFGDDELFDAGSGHEFSVNEVADYCKSVACSSSEIVHHPMRDGERPHTKLCAAGAGWDKLARKPRLNIVELDRAIRSYKP